MTVVLILSIKYQTLRSVPVRPTANLHDCQKPDFKSNVPIREIRSQYVLIVLYSIEAKADQCLAKYLSFFASCARSRPIPGKTFRLLFCFPLTGERMTTMMMRVIRLDMSINFIFTNRLKAVGSLLSLIFSISFIIK